MTELPTWSVAVDGDTVLVPPPLTATPPATGQTLDGSAPTEARYELAGLVAFDACGHDAHAGAGDEPLDAADAPADDRLATTRPSIIRPLRARCSPDSPPAIRRTSGSTRSSELVAAGRVHASTDRAEAAEQLRRLLGADDPTG